MTQRGETQRGIRHRGERDMREGGKRHRAEGNRMIFELTQVEKELAMKNLRFKAILYSALPAS